MEVSLPVYEEITGLPELPPPVDEADYERRKYRRVPFGHRATISSIGGESDGDNTDVVMVRDISVSGLSFLHSDPIRQGTPFIVEFRGHHDRSVKLRCAAARCEPGGSGGTQFVIGASFEELLTKESPAEVGLETPATTAKASDAVAAAAPVEPPIKLQEPAKPAEVPAAPAATIDASPTAPPAPAAPAAPPATAAAARPAGLFKAASAADAKPKETYWAETGADIIPAAPDPKPQPQPEAPTFRVIPLPDPPKEPAPLPVVEVVESHPAPAPAPAPAPVPVGESHVKTPEILARVKELLLQQERTIESQRAQLSRHRQQFENEIATLRTELEAARRESAELRAKCAAEETAVAELANFLNEHTPKNQAA